jgi:hypothetical protein
MPSPSEIECGRETNREFLDKIDGWVEQAVHDRSLSFREILELLPSVYPAEVIGALSRLEKRGTIPTNFRSGILKAVRTERTRKSEETILWSRSAKIEHPLDFEWLFTRQGNKTLATQLNEFHKGSPGKILCIGCPTFYSYAKSARLRYQVDLWDKNATAVGQVCEAIALARVGETRKPITAAVLDPPWYLDFYKVFIGLAVRNLSIGGRILLSFPPEGTRPTAVTDLTQLLGWCRGIGVDFVAHRRTILRYRTPFFELNALRALGFRNVPFDWRRGDLLVLEKRTNITPLSEKICLPCEDWSEYKMGLVRIKIRKQIDTSRAGRLCPIGYTAVLPSVSTRYPNRNRANVVSSGNRFFHTASPRLIAELCEELGDGQVRRRSLPRPESGRRISAVHQQLKSLIRREHAEILRYIAMTHGL